MTKKATIQGDFYGYSVTENGKTIFEPIGRAIFIRAIQREIETGDVFFRVCFHYSGYEVLETLPRQSFNRSGLMKLQTKGADVFDNSFPCLIDVLKQQEATINIENIHQGLGWYPVPSKKYKAKMVKIFRSNYINYLNSTYNGNFDIEPIGSQEKWLEMIQEHVIGTNMELPLILGFSAAVNGYLANALDVKNLFVHFYGDSSTGKSTALQLAISVAGNPTPSEKSLFMSWNATSNALIHVLADNNGYPVAIDETSMSGEEEFTSLIYRLSSGQDKRRMNKDLSLNKTPTFCTTLLSSGEHSLLAKSKKNTGLRARLIEFGNLELTTSAEQAEAIKAVIMENHGHAIAPFATFIKKNYSKEELMKKLNFYRQKYLEKSSIQDSLSNRVSSKYAIILLTTRLVKECFDLHLSLYYMMNLLIENEKSSQSRDIGVQAYEYLIEYININANFFLFDDNSDHTCYGKIIGKIEKLANPYINRKGEKFRHELTFIKSECEKALNTGGFEDVSIIMKKFKAMELLNFEKDRNTRKRKLFNDGQVLPCYVIRME